MAMLNKTAFAAVATAVMVMAGPASAFTPEGSIMETSDSKISSTWQPMVAQRNDSIAKACQGFVYAPCVREVVQANRSRLPEEFSKESDFWLYTGTTYMVPLLSGVLPSAIEKPTKSTEPQPSLVEIMKGYSTEQEKMVAELARLSKDFGLLAVEDIDGLGDTLAEVRQQTEGFAEVRETVQRLEEAYGQLQNGDLTSGMLNTIQAQNEAALEPVFADIEALKQADITFSKRLDVVEADVANLTEQIPTVVKDEVKIQFDEQLPAMTEAAENAAKETATTVVGEANYWNYWLTWAALIIALLAIVGVWWTRRSVNTSKKELTGQIAKQEEKFAGKKDQEILRKNVEGVATEHKALSAEVHDEHDGLAATRDLAATALSQNSSLKFLETPDLKFVNKGATSHWSMTSGDTQTDDLQTFEVCFTKREDGLFDWSVPRNQDGSGDSQPVAYKSVEKMRTKLLQAHINGRLKHCEVQEAKPGAQPA